MVPPEPSGPTWATRSLGAPESTIRATQRRSSHSGAHDARPGTATAEIAGPGPDRRH